MDTATHIVMGVGLTALATQDPVMAESFCCYCDDFNRRFLIPDVILY